MTINTTSTLVNSRYHHFRGIDDLHRTRNPNDSYNSRILSLAQIYEHIESRTVVNGATDNCPNNIQGYIPISLNEPDHFHDIQLILAINNDTIALKLNKTPNSIYYCNYQFNCITQDYYRCTGPGCRVYISWVENNNGFRITNNHPHSRACFKPTNKRDLIYKLIKQEMYYNVSHEYDIQCVPLAKHYRRIISKYEFRFPGLDLLYFPTMHHLQSSLKQKKQTTMKLTASSTAQFFNTQWDSILDCLASSYIQKQYLQSSIIKVCNNEAVLLSHKTLIKIFYSAKAWGGDGTFNTRPCFIKCRQ